MRIACTFAFVVSLALGSAALAEDGQSPGDTSKSTVAQLSLGEYWFGARIEKEDLVGKVVLFEIWGS